MFEYMSRFIALCLSLSLSLFLFLSFSLFLSLSHSLSLTKNVASHSQVVAHRLSPRLMNDERYVARRERRWAQGAKIGPAFRGSGAKHSLMSDVSGPSYISGIATPTKACVTPSPNEHSGNTPAGGSQRPLGLLTTVTLDFETSSVAESDSDSEDVGAGSKNKRVKKCGQKRGRGSQMCGLPPWWLNNPSLRPLLAATDGCKRAKQRMADRERCRALPGSDVSGPSLISDIATHKKACVTRWPNPHFGNTRAAGGSDAGGCMVVALNKCCPGVLTAGELDEQIEKLHEELNKQREWAPNNYKMEWCGIPGVTWHQNCILKALKKKYPPSSTGVHWRKLPANSMYEPGHGKLYVHGLLNKALWPEIDQSSNWQHSICVNTDTGRFFDGNTNRWRSVAKWLQCPEEDRYMSEIWRVYTLSLVGNNL
jgi:hypothetical protein